MPYTVAHLAAPMLVAKAIGVGVLATARIRGRRVHVYWAEDAVDDQYLIKQALPRVENVPKVEFFADGQALLDAVARRKPDLIVLDLNMPGLDGVTVLRRLRKLYPSDVLPAVIFSTARNEPEERACRELGIAEFVQKPAQLEGLDAAVVRILGYA